MRWCTSLLLIKPLEDRIGGDKVMSYVTIHADKKSRTGYVSTKPNIKTAFPFIEDDVDHVGVVRILENAGINLPDYCKWRIRSGCYFCFFQRKAEWVGLADNPPDLFERAVVIEQKILKDAGVSGDADFKSCSMKGRQYTWSEDETLTELLKRRDEIISRREENINKAKLKRKNSPLVDVLSDALDEDDEKTPCAVCHL